jgi:hypothetical protein
VFYSDFVYDDKKQIGLAKIPKVEVDMLKEVIDELQIVVDDYFKVTV